MIYAPGLLHNILHLDNSTQLRRCRLQAYYTIALVITSRFQDNLRKSIPECQTSLGFAAARDDGGGGGAKMCQSY